VLLVPAALKTLPLHRRQFFAHREAEMTKTCQRRSSNVTSSISTRGLKPTTGPTIESRLVVWRIKELDKVIREARKVAALAASLADKLAAQEHIKTLEHTRKNAANDCTKPKTIDRTPRRTDEQIEGQLRPAKSVYTRCQLP